MIEIDWTSFLLGGGVALALVVFVALRALSR